MNHIHGLLYIHEAISDFSRTFSSMTLKGQVKVTAHNQFFMEFILESRLALAQFSHAQRSRDSLSHWKPHDLKSPEHAVFYFI